MLGHDTETVLREEFQARRMAVAVGREDDIANLVLRDGLLAAVQQIELSSLDVGVQNVEEIDAVLAHIIIYGDLRKAIPAIVPIGEDRVGARVTTDEAVGESSLHVVQLKVALAELKFFPVRFDEMVLRAGNRLVEPHRIVGPETPGLDHDRAGRECFQHFVEDFFLLRFVMALQAPDDFRHPVTVIRTFENLHAVVHDLHRWVTRQHFASVGHFGHIITVMTVDSGENALALLRCEAVEIRVRRRGGGPRHEEILLVVGRQSVALFREEVEDGFPVFAVLHDDELRIEPTEIEALQHLEVVALGIDGEQVHVSDAGLIKNGSQPQRRNFLLRPDSSVLLLPSFLVFSRDGRDIAAPVGEMRVSGHVKLHLTVRVRSARADTANVGATIRCFQLGEVLPNRLDADSTPTVLLDEPADVAVVDPVERADFHEHLRSRRMLLEEAFDALVVVALRVIATCVLRQFACEPEFRIGFKNRPAGFVQQRNIPALFGCLGEIPADSPMSTPRLRGLHELLAPFDVSSRRSQIQPGPKREESIGWVCIASPVHLVELSQAHADNDLLGVEDVLETLRVVDDAAADVHRVLE